MQVLNYIIITRYSINPNYTDALTSLAFLLADNGKLEEGQAMMQKAASIAPNQPDVLSNFASYLVRMGELRVMGKSGVVWVVEWCGWLWCG